MEDNENKSGDDRPSEARSNVGAPIQTSNELSDKSSPSHSRIIGASVTRENVSSPIESQTSQSTSSRNGEKRKVIEILHSSGDDTSEIAHPADNWTIGEDFYQVDVAEDDEDMSERFDDDYYRLSRDIDTDTHDDEDDDDDDDDDIDDDDEGDDVGERMGFELAPNESDHLDGTSDEEDAEDAEDGNAIAYDIRIPVEHPYLGNLEKSSGQELIENCEATLPLLNLSHIVLLPGQVLPITTDNLNPGIHRFLLNSITRGKCLVGIVPGPRENQYGTTAEIRNYARSNDEDGENQMKIIMKGRQRFRILCQPFDTATEGLVKILPENSLGCLYPEISSWRRLIIRRNISSKFIVSKHKKWLIQYHDAHSLTRRIIHQIKEWCDKAPINPNNFSYWVASNLPISNLERMRLLKLDYTEERLMWLLHLLNEKEFLGCSACQNMICHRNDVFLMSECGPQNSFVNPDGYVHDTLTVKKANGLVYQSSWSTRCTWFPGYAWRIASCEYCSRHIGWCYKSSLPKTKPRKFWGLSRVNVQLQSNVITDEERDSSQMIVF